MQFANFYVTKHYIVRLKYTLASLLHITYFIKKIKTKEHQKNWCQKNNSFKFYIYRKYFGRFLTNNPIVWF